MHLAKVGKLDVACLDLDEDQQTAFNMIDNLGGLIRDYDPNESQKVMLARAAAGGRIEPEYLLVDTPAGLPKGKNASSNRQS